jgi:hypothetical protein
MADPGAATPFLARLRGMLDQRPQWRPGERCELCGTPIGEPHGHLVNMESRSLVCACRPCYLLFDHPGMASGKFRAVPATCRHAREMTLGDELWDGLQIPVDIAFFFVNSAQGRTVAFYPSPAGATESLLSLDAWRAIVEANPALAALIPDVQALLVYRRAPREAPATFECHIVPIDACYELVGRMRRQWKGFQGGEEAWREIEGFFAELRRRGGDGDDELAAEPAGASS